MATNEDYIANEARRQELRVATAQLRGAANAMASVMQRLSSVNNDTMRQLEDCQAELSALEAGSGPGVTANFGPKSTITQLIEKERFAAKAAAIDFIKANPDCSETDAAVAWNAAALASHPDFPSVIQDGLVMSALYRANLMAAKDIAENTWEAHRQFILNTDTATLVTL